MKKGDYIYTPRFCSVRIEEVFENRDEARKNGYTEPTHYKGDYDVLGKSIGVNRMVFAVVKKVGGSKMNKFEPEHGSMEMWLVCEAIGKNHDLIDKMQKNEDGTYPVVFSVGGIELDFSLVAKRIDEQISELVTAKAMELLDERYEGLIGEIMNIQERIENQKERFKYDWESQ